MHWQQSDSLRWVAILASKNTVKWIIYLNYNINWFLLQCMHCAVHIRNVNAFWFMLLNFRQYEYCIMKKNCLLFRLFFCQHQICTAFSLEYLLCILDIIWQKIFSVFLLCFVSASVFITSVELNMFNIFQSRSIRKRCQMENESNVGNDFMFF